MYNPMLPTNSISLAKWWVLASRNEKEIAVVATIVCVAVWVGLVLEVMELLRQGKESRWK